MTPATHLPQERKVIHAVHDLDGNRIAEYVLDDGAPPQLLREYIWLDGMVVAVVENEQLYFVRTDHIHRPVFATDATGTKVWEATYLPFGGVHTTTGDPIALRFPGQWFQSESGLHQNWMRDYDPVTGRYMQADPLGLVDGASVYGYALQNPGRYVDPKGLYVWTWRVVLSFLRSRGGGAAAGAGAGATLSTSTVIPFPGPNQPGNGPPNGPTINDTQCSGPKCGFVTEVPGEIVERIRSGFNSPRYPSKGCIYKCLDIYGEFYVLRSIPANFSCPKDTDYQRTGLDNFGMINTADKLTLRISGIPLP